MSKNRILYAVLKDHSKTEGVIVTLQRVVISPGKTLADAWEKVDEMYPTATCLGWCNTFTSRYNGSADIHVE